MPTIAFENAAPAMSEPSARFVRASVSPPFAQATGRFAAISWMAFTANASLTGFFWMDVYASMACVSASMPVVAVSFGGSEAVSAGSRMAACGTSLYEVNDSLACAFVSATTATSVTSLPVPAVVGTAMNGGRSAFNISEPCNVAKSTPLHANDAAAPFVVSMTEPPPMATKPSQPRWPYSCATSFTTSIEESGGTWSNTSYGTPAASSTSVSFAATPSFMSPASVMTSGCFTPRDANSSGSLSSACAPHTIFVGQKNSKPFKGTSSEVDGPPG